MKTIILILIAWAFFLPRAEALEISASGGWSRTITSSDLTAGAGSDLKSTYESASNATTINILGVTWQVAVRRVDTSWNSDFVLSVKRTSDGTGKGSTISGGLSYVTVGTTDSAFFSGTKNKTGINLQYQLSGVSITIPPGNYSTSITFTITGN